MAAVLIAGFPAEATIVPIIMGVTAPITSIFLEEAGTAAQLLSTSFIFGAFGSLVAGVGADLVIALATAAIGGAIVVVFAALKWLIVGFPTDAGFWRRVWDLLTAANINEKSSRA